MAQCSHYWFRLCVYFNDSTTAPEDARAVYTPWMASPLGAVMAAERCLNMRSEWRCGFAMEWTNDPGNGSAFLWSDEWGEEMDAFYDQWIAEQAPTRRELAAKCAHEWVKIHHDDGSPFTCTKCPATASAYRD